MSDQPGWVYSDGNTTVYRASSLGGCLRSLVAARLGEDASPPHANLRAAMDASSGLEDEILRRYSIEMATSEILWQQKTVELSAGENIVIRGHLDALSQFDDTILEVKAFGDNYFERFISGGLGALPNHLGDKYRMQMAIYGHATERKVRLVVGHKKKVDFSGEKGGGEGSWFIEEVDIGPPVDPADLYTVDYLRSRIATIEEWAAKDELPPCTHGCREGDPYGEVHLFDSPVAGDDELTQLLAEYHDAKMAEEDAKDRKDSIREAIITTYGVGKYTAGRFSCRVEQVKGTQRIDSKKVKKMYPDVYEECSTFSAPTIRVTVTGGEKRDD